MIYEELRKGLFYLSICNESLNFASIKLEFKSLKKNVV